MANKTESTAIDTRTYLEGWLKPGLREDSLHLLELMSQVSGEPGIMWGRTMIGFDSYRYRYASGRESEALRMGFAPRTRQLVIYGGYPEQLSAQLTELGPHKTGTSCIYLKRLADVDPIRLRELLERIWAADPPPTGRTEAHPPTCQNLMRR